MDSAQDMPVPGATARDEDVRGEAARLRVRLAAAHERLAALARSHDIAVVLITHALEVVEEHADDVIFFDRTGRRVLFGPRDEILSHGVYERHLRGDKIDPGPGPVEGLDHAG